MLKTIDLILTALNSLLDVIPIAEAIKSSVKNSPAKQLYNTLDKDHSITTKAELYYQLKCYVPQNFRTADNKILSTKKILDQIKHSEGDLFAVTGKPASGKTTAMRYLYYKLSKTRKCVYFQMKNVKDSDSLKMYLAEQKTKNKINDNEEVIAFFDGLDEARFFIQNEDFHSVFLKGVDSKIQPIFRENNLFLESMVFGIRPEFLEKSTRDLQFQMEKISMQIFETTKMSDKDVIKVFKSLKTLMKMDKKYSRNKSRHLMEYSKYPPKKEERKYVKLLKKILKNNPDSLFHYPMYIRYAYAFMKEYEEQKNSDSGKSISINDITISLHVLVDAIMKWEFHVYYHCSARSNPKMWEEFRNGMEEFMNSIIKIMLTDGVQTLARGQLLEILNNCSLPSEEGMDRQPLAIAHCFMISNEDGEYFEFSHFTFYEYFLAKYLLEKADYQTRIQCLLPEAVSDNFERIYYALLCAEETLNKNISGSIGNWDGKKMTVNECLELRKETILIVDDPIVSMTEILEYLPVIQKFSYRGLYYTREQLEGIVSTGVLDLAPTGWDRIRYARALLPPKYVRELLLRGLPLKDVDTLENYDSLKRLDFRVHEDSVSLIHSALLAVRNFPLEWIHIFTEDCSTFDEINALMDKKELNAEKIFVDLPDYSETYPKVYQLNTQACQAGQGLRFLVKKRTGLGRAQTEYNTNNANKNHDILKAVFELEADASGALGLEGKEAAATLWNGLSLAQYYYYLDWTDEDGRAYQICDRLEPYIEKNGDKLSVHYGKTFGQILTHIGNRKSKSWLAYTYEYAPEHFSEADTIDIAIKLYRARIRCRDNDLDPFADTLETRIKGLPDYPMDHKYLLYLKYSIVRTLNSWKKGEKIPENLDGQNLFFREAAEKYAEKKKKYSLLTSAIYYALLSANRAERGEEAAKLLDDFETAIQEAYEGNDERNRQGNWIQYHEQKLYWLFLTLQNTEAISVADALLEYEYRSKDKTEDAYRYIREACLPDDDRKDENIDRHRLWNAVWY